MITIDRMATALLEPINPSFTILLSVYAFLWGFWLAQPFWSVYSASLALSNLSFFPGYVWGLWALGVSALISRGAIKPSYSNLQLGAMLGFFHWFVIMLVLMTGDVTNPAWLTFALLSAYTALIWVNVKVNSAYYDEKVKRIIREDKQ